MPITQSTSLSQIIDDFVHSDNPKFDGKSKEERIEMAKGAFYGMHKESTGEENMSLAEKKAKFDDGEPLNRPDNKKKNKPAKTNTKRIESEVKVIENINDYIAMTSAGNYEGAQAALMDALNTKVANRLSDMKIEVAQKYFDMQGK